MCGVIDILVGKGVSVGSGGVSESLSCFGGVAWVIQGL